ncbi:hypothetical protein G6F37_003887 [Rhizopus arrhizus]|nr:hypothetical protein G6F38_000931 [Rhizopus arrhizus]KAG1160553.1 hypothetical protein G6F37_003887 [Rhizopus arrhizus]
MTIFALFGRPRYAPQQQVTPITAETTYSEPVNHRHPNFSIWTHHIANRFLPLLASLPLPKSAKLKRDNSQPSLTAIARQLSSPIEPTSFKLIRVSIRCHLSLQQLRCNLCRLHINTHRVLDIHYLDGNLVSFLIHISYETDLCSQLNKFNITVCDAFNPLDSSIIRDPTLVNEPIDCKVQHVHKAFLHQIRATLQRFSTLIYNAVTNFFV